MSGIGSDSISGSPLKHATPHMLAVTMLRQIMDRASEWGATDAAVSEQTHAKLPLACEFYQLRIFLDLLKQRFGTGISSLVESSLVSVLNVQGNNSGDDWFSRYMTAISVARELGPADGCLDNIKIGVDVQVADQVLAIINESDSEKQALRLAFAESLTYARIWAEAIFPELIVKIDFDPASVAFVRVETAYKGLTNRWREHPGCFERHLQRMEGNPIFPELHRNPTDHDIYLAQARDTADLEELMLQMHDLLSDLQTQSKLDRPTKSDLLALMQHRIEPLMVRAAEIGQLPPAVHHLGILWDLMESMMDQLQLPTATRESFRKDWQRKTNVFIAQEWRADSPSKSIEFDPLLCEAVEEIEIILGIYQELNPKVVISRRELALKYLETARLVGFTFPGANEKLALFLGNVHSNSNYSDTQQSPWWRFRRSTESKNKKDR